MAARRPRTPDTPNSLFVVLDSAPEEVLSALIDDPRAQNEPEFVNVLIRLFCLWVDSGKYPALSLQRYIASILSVALEGNTKDRNQRALRMIGKTTVEGRRDFWLSSTIWNLLRDDRSSGARRNKAYMTAANRWNRLYKSKTYKVVSTKTAARASRRFSWLDAFRASLEEFIIDRNVSELPLSTDPTPLPISFGGFCKVVAPTACICEVPKAGQQPRDRQHARTLCRSFIIAIEHYNGVVLPGLLPYISHALNRVIGGALLSKELGIDRVQAGRPPRNDSPTDWLTDSDQDQRDLWLAEEILRISETLPKRHDKPQGKAYIEAAKRWTKKNPDRPIAKDTARTAWKRWGSYVEIRALGHQYGQKIEEERRAIRDRIASLSPLHPKLWAALIRRARTAVNSSEIDEAFLGETQLRLVASDMLPHPHIDFIQMLAGLAEIGLIKLSNKGGRRTVRIFNYYRRANDVGIGRKLEGSGNGHYHEVPADERQPLFLPNSQGRSKH
jgi:hypothetical protein